MNQNGDGIQDGGLAQDAVEADEAETSAKRDYLLNVRAVLRLLPLDATCSMQEGVTERQEL